ncbi:hypothetical protein GY45DRAFT_1326908 [Cubamyces sp. BRFM 1775]|nr:hypothetical protein GY45DRAFT_1326908 [Cubamyces sp. BRFM 1775]
MENVPVASSKALSYSDSRTASTSSMQGVDCAVDIRPASRQFLVRKGAADSVDTFDDDDDTWPSRRSYYRMRYVQHISLRSGDRVLLNVLSEGRSRWVHGEVCDLSKKPPRIQSKTHIIYPARWTDCGVVKVAFFDPHHYTILYDRYLSEFPERYALEC